MVARVVVIVGGARTAIGKFGGGFKEMPAHKLGAAAIKAALERAGVSKDAEGARGFYCKTPVEKTADGSKVTKWCDEHPTQRWVQGRAAIR